MQETGNHHLWDQRWAREKLQELGTRAEKRLLNPPWGIREGFLEEVATWS